MNREKLEEMVRRYRHEQGATIAVLHDIQSEFNYLPEEALLLAAETMKVPLTQLYSLATFYKAFSLKPRGRHTIKCCLGTACHVRGAPRILDKIERELGIKAGETSADRKWTLETVNCLGACAMGPLMVVDNRFYGKLALTKVDQILKSYK